MAASIVSSVDGNNMGVAVKRVGWKEGEKALEEERVGGV